MYVRHTDLYVKPQHLDDFIRVLTTRARMLRGSDPAIKRIDVMQSSQNPHILIILEIYEDKAAWERLGNDSRAQAFDSQTTPWLEPGKKRVDEARNIEPTDAEWETAYLDVHSAKGQHGPTYTHNGPISVQPLRRDEYKRLLVDEVRLAKQMERGIIRFDIYQNLDNPNLFYTYEVYTDRDAHHYHYEQSYLKDFYLTGVPLMDRSRPLDRSNECHSLDPTDAEWLANKYA